MLNTQHLGSIFVLLVIFPIGGLAQSFMNFSTDAECRLEVNGIHRGTLSVGESESVMVMPGDQLVRCRTDRAYFEETYWVSDGQQRRIRIRLEDYLNRLTRSAEDRYTVARDGVVIDEATGFFWTQKVPERAHDVSWSGAVEYCRSLGISGLRWRLPTADELKSIIYPEGTFDTSCGTFLFMTQECQISSHFDVNDSTAWAGVAGQRARTAATISLKNGFPVTSNIGHGRPKATSLALCVADPS
jgi:hypothetical protein